MRGSRGSQGFQTAGRTYMWHDVTVMLSSEPCRQVHTESTHTHTSCTGRVCGRVCVCVSACDPPAWPGRPHSLSRIAPIGVLLAPHPSSSSVLPLGSHTQQLCPRRTPAKERPGKAPAAHAYAYAGGIGDANGVPHVPRPIHVFPHTHHRAGAGARVCVCAGRSLSFFIFLFSISRSRCPPTPTQKVWVELSRARSGNVPPWSVQTLRVAQNEAKAESNSAYTEGLLLFLPL